MRNIFIILLFAVSCLNSRAQQILSSDVPFIGAQVFIEPGQTPEQIDRWFTLMEQNMMTVCRIRMFQQYMEKADGTYDFSLFDTAFDAAQRHHVKVYCTFFPTTVRTDIGGWKFPKDIAQHNSFMQFIEQLVAHYRQHPALKGWVLINEPGSDGRLPESQYLADAHALWIQLHPEQSATVPDASSATVPEESSSVIIDSEGYPIITSPRRQSFIYDVTADYLKRIADEVRRHDTHHDIHVNPANVFGNYGEYAFSRWRTFLTSLGGSAHPSWHYFMFPRHRYAHAMAIEAEMLRSAAGTLPWFMTEIQGGNNTYSGGRAICPTAAETAQWLWTVIGTEGKGGIFWSLNARSAGIEAGEWAMVDYLDNASDRLRTAGDIAKVIHRDRRFFSTARQQLSGIDIVYAKESRWAEQLMCSPDDDVVTARRDHAVFKSIAACYKALADHGIQASVTSLDDYDFSQSDYAGRTIILTQQIALPRSAKANLKTFVERGGTLIVEGMTSYFDENLHCMMMSDYWADLFGGRVSEFQCLDPQYPLPNIHHPIPIHWQRGIIADTEAMSVTHAISRGKVVWLPSCIALGAWDTDDYRPLGEWLMSVCPSIDNCVRYDSNSTDILLRVLVNNKEVVVILINKSGSKKTVTLANLPATNPVRSRSVSHRLTASPSDIHPTTLYSIGKSEVKGTHVTLDAESTIVIKY